MKIGGEDTDQSITDGHHNTQVGRDFTLNGITFDEFKQTIEEKDARIEELIADKTRADVLHELAEKDREKLKQEVAELRSQHDALRNMMQNPQQAFRDHQARETQMGEILCDIGMQNAFGHNRIQAALNDFNALDYEAVDDLLAEAEQQGIQQAVKSAFGRGLNAENAVRWQDAYTHYKRAYYLDEGNIDALQSYARMTWLLHKGAEGVPLHERLRDWARVEYGAESAEYATQLNNLAALYKAQGRLNEAEPLYKEAVVILRAALPEGHPDIATDLNNLAGLYQAQGRLNEAEPLFQEALTICRIALPKGHPDIAQSLNNLAGLYRVQGRLSEAEPLYNEALAIRRAALPEGHPLIASSLNNLALLYKAQGRLNEAEQLFDEALAIRRVALPEGHPDIATSLNNLALLRYFQERFDEAVPLFREALEIFEKALPAGHPHTEGTRQSLEAVYTLHPHLRDSSD